MLKGRKAPTTVPSLCACHKGPVRPRLEISKDQYEVFTKWNIAMHQDSALLRPLEQTYMESCLLQLSPWRQNAVVWHHTLNSRDEVSWHLSSQIKHLHSLFSVVPNHLGHLSINRQQQHMNNKNDFMERRRLNEIWLWFNLLSSLETKESVCTLSQNLYVSQQTSTGTFDAYAIIATIEEPTRDLT